MLNYIANHIILFTTIIFSVILLIYIIFSLVDSGSILISKHVASHEIINADMIYYLPTASLQLKSTLKVAVIKDATTNVIESAHFLELSFENVVSVIPDTDFLFMLNYAGSWFMNDEIKLTAGSSGLLESISTTTEDRFSNIMSEIAEVPSKILTVKPALVQNGLENKISETITYNKDFNISSKEIGNKSAKCPWIINTDGTINEVTNVNASFEIDFLFPSEAKRKTSFGENNTLGILTRPTVTVTTKIKLADQNLSPNLGVETYIQIPDESRLINITVNRSPFVKRINTPTFTTGMLTGNYINKPSEFEGLISIPINICKAIVSIPSQLFNFKIQHKYQDTLSELEMQKKITDLKKQLQAAKANA